ncbi:hypothetical protein HHI36_007127 [Cryptolaemus montrouzieri]|uniref:39S ribosomal protein L55, mitochondrial n=1 Tax=Cryptolaemus montrouzieri TaxID=559131 RepID=A0ABD2MNK8_9CUCU
MKLSQLRLLNALSASITKPHRCTYTRTYPTTLVNPDGSSFTIRFPEPREILTLPLNIWTLSEAERKARIDSRKPKKKVKYEDDFEDGYDSKKYLKLLKKNK